MNNNTKSIRRNQVTVYPAFVHPDDCVTCQHYAQTGSNIPGSDITPELMELLCPNCRSQLPTDKCNCPIDNHKLEGLFLYIDGCFEENPKCDNTLRHAAQYCRDTRIPMRKLLPWLRGQGGYCDCEVLYNIAERYCPSSEEASE